MAEFFFGRLPLLEDEKNDAEVVEVAHVVIKGWIVLQSSSMVNRRSSVNNFCRSSFGGDHLQHLPPQPQGNADHLPQLTADE